MSGIDADTWNCVRAQNDVVLFRAAKLDESQLRLREMNAVDTLGIAHMPAVWLLDSALTVHVVVCGVVHAVLFAVMKQRTVGARIPLPRSIGDESDIPTDRSVHLQPQRFTHGVDEVVVNHQFPPRANVNRFACAQRMIQQDKQEKDRVSFHVVLHA